MSSGIDSRSKLAPVTGLDPRFPCVIGCDPGPEYCAFVAVRQIKQSGSTAVGVGSVAYLPFADVLTGKVVDMFRSEHDPVFAFEAMSHRFGVTPGKTVFDSCRNSGMAAASMASICRRVYGIPTAVWRLSVGGSTRMSDSDVRRYLTDVMAADVETINKYSVARKKELGLVKPIGVHMRDAAAVAIGLMMGRSASVDVEGFLVWERKR